MVLRGWGGMGKALLEGGWSPNYLVTSFFNVNTLTRTSQVALVIKNLPTNAGDTGDTGLVPGSQDPLEEAMTNHSGYSVLENPMDRGDWQELNTTEQLSTHPHSSQPEIQTLAWWTTRHIYICITNTSIYQAQALGSSFHPSLAESPTLCRRVAKISLPALHTLTGEPLARLTSVSHTFLFCKMGLVIPALSASEYFLLARRMTLCQKATWK